MIGKTPAVGTILRSEDTTDVTMVIQVGTSKFDALRYLVAEYYGGELMTQTNTVLNAELDKTRVEMWRSCTKKYLEAADIDAEDYDGWWAPDGDGAREIAVVTYEGDLYDLGDRAAKVEPDELTMETTGH